MSSIIKEIILCHYDVKPYRDAFHRRNFPGYLLCCSFLLLLVLTIISGLMVSSSSQDSPISDTFINELSALANLNRTTILKDTKQIYPTDLELSITPNKITSNKQFPICFAAPQFLMPLLKSASPDDNQINNDKIDINDIKKTYYNTENDILMNTKDWLKAPSFFNDDTNNNKFDDNPFENLRIEDMWESIIGYEIDPQCFIRIDTSSSKILKQLESANVEQSQWNNVICNNNNNVFTVMKPSFMVINPDNGMIYQLNVNTFYSNNALCYAYSNTFKYDVMNKNKFDELLSEENESVKKFFDDMSRWMTIFLIIIIIVIAVVYFGWMGFILICMLLEGFVATIIVWIIVGILKCFDTFKPFGNISPTFRQIWRINVLICVPDFSFVRLLQATSIAFYWRILARVIITLLLIIDVYQHDPPNIN